MGRRGNVLGQEIVDLVKSQVALLAPEREETLQVLPFVLLLHAPKLPYQPASSPAGVRQRVPSMRRQQIFSDDARNRACYRPPKKTAERAPLRRAPQVAALVIQDEVFGRHPPPV